MTAIDWSESAKEAKIAQNAQIILKKLYKINLSQNLLQSLDRIAHKGNPPPLDVLNAAREVMHNAVQVEKEGVDGEVAAESVWKSIFNNFIDFNFLYF